METKQKRARIVVSILALTGLLVFGLTAIGGDLEPSGPPTTGTMKTLDEVEPRIPISQADIPKTIDAPGSYYLTCNLASTSEKALTIDANDVTLDLNGHTLQGTDPAADYGIYMNERKNIEIRNGTVRDFDFVAIDALGSDTSDIRVFNVSVINNNYGIRLWGATTHSGGGHIVKNCTAYEHVNSGIKVGPGSVVTHCTAHQNLNGIVAGKGSTVAYCSSYKNTGTGIHTSGLSTITNNTCTENSKGIHTNNGCTVIANNACDNQGWGIYLGSNNMVNNNCCYNNNEGNENMNFRSDCTYGTNHAPLPK